MTQDPLSEIRRVERSVSLATAEATSEAATAVDEARRSADQLVADAGARGLATAAQRYKEGLERARAEADKILADGDEKVAALRRQAEAQLSDAVDVVMAMVLPGED